MFLKNANLYSAYRKSTIYPFDFMHNRIRGTDFAETNLVTLKPPNKLVFLCNTTAYTRVLWL